MILVMSRTMIRLRWQEIKRDPANPRPDIQTAEEFIKEIETNKDFRIYGATVVLQEKMPKVI